MWQRRACVELIQVWHEREKCVEIEKDKRERERERERKKEREPGRRNVTATLPQIYSSPFPTGFASPVSNLSD